MKEIVPLSSVKTGSVAKVVGFQMKWRAAFHSHDTGSHFIKKLQEMGIIKDEAVEVERNQVRGTTDFHSHSTVSHFIRRVQEMGVMKDEIIEVERNSGVGPIQIKVKGTHIALGRGVSSRILVEIQDEQKES